MSQKPPARAGAGDRQAAQGMETTPAGEALGLLPTDPGGGPGPEKARAHDPGAETEPAPRHTPATAASDPKPALDPVEVQTLLGAGTDSRRALREQLRMRRLWPALLTLLCGIVATLLLTRVLEQRERAARGMSIIEDASEAIAGIRLAFVVPLEDVYQLVGMWTHAQPPTRAQFSALLRGALERTPDLHAFEWIPVVPAAQRKALEAAAQADGLLGFTLRDRTPAGRPVPAPERPFYMPIYYMEPPDPALLGLDLHTESVRHNWLERACRENALVLTSTHALTERTSGGPVLVGMHAVHGPAVTTDAPPCLGVVTALWRVRELVEGTLTDDERARYRLALFDLDARPGRQLLFESESGFFAELEKDADLRARAFVTEFPIADHKFRLIVVARPRPLSDSPARVVLFAGLGASALLSLLLAALLSLRGVRQAVEASLRLGQYTLVQRLGRGGMGVVYEARHRMLARPVAIKFIRDADKDANALRRFENEARATAALRSAHTICIYDYGRTPSGAFYYVMELLEGMDLDHLVRRYGPVPAARAIRFLRQACSSLAEAHARGLVHRDIKPANLFSSRSGLERDFLKVLDFGLAKLNKELWGSEVAITQRGAAPGTPAFMPPEIFAGKEADARTDIYMLGCVAYWLLTGKLVFEGRHGLDVARKHAGTVPEPPSSRVSRPLPPEVDALVLACLAKDPAARPQTVRDLERMLAQCARVLETRGEAWTESDAERFWAQRPAAGPAAARDKAEPPSSDPSMSGSDLKLFS